MKEPMRDGGFCVICRSNSHSSTFQTFSVELKLNGQSKMKMLHMSTDLFLHGALFFLLVCTTRKPALQTCWKDYHGFADSQPLYISLSVAS